jgi:mannose-6-phosphate isomerase-like protein (cupin superfamily)
MQEMTKRNPYAEWQERQGIPIVTGLNIEDLNEPKLAPWKAMGGSGAFVMLGTKPGYRNGSWLQEIPAGEALPPKKHMFEEQIYVVSGRGATTLWVEGREDRKQMVEWQEGSLLAIPLNAWAQHFNSSGDTPARFLSYNNAPTMINLFHNDDYIWNNPFVFEDRFADELGLFTGEGKLYAVPKKSYRVWATNFVPNAATLQLYEWKERGAGGVNVFLEMGDAALPSHISQFPVGTYKKAHVHSRGQDIGGGALLLILEGVGFTLVWQPGDKQFRRLNWRKNGMVVAPSSYYHQHFNTGSTPARYLAFRGGGSNRYGTEENNADVDENQGGIQIEYPNENSEIHRIFEEDLAKHGAACKMGELSPFCTAKAVTA